MFILASKHRAVVAEKDAEIAALQQACNFARGGERAANELAVRSQADYHALSLRVAEFADRALPPPRKTEVRQPLSIDKADGAVVKRLREGKA